MKVTIVVTGWFKKFTGGKGTVELALEYGITAYDAVCRAGVPRNEIGFITVVTEAPRLVDESYMVRDGDELKAYPLIIGG